MAKLRRDDPKIRQAGQTASDPTEMNAAASQKRKRNHWVPQVYLRAFAADEQRRKIWRFSNEHGADPELKPIEKVAVKHHLYTKTTAAGRDYSFEAKLSSLETLFASPLWKTACEDFIDLTSQTNRKALALLTAVMYLRNPAQFQATQALHRSFVEMISSDNELPDEIEINGIRSTINAAEWPAYRDAGDEDIRRMWLDQIGTATWLAELLMAMRWSMIFAEEPVFITSDHPVSVTHPDLTFRGFKNANTIVFFPVSPTRILVMDNKHTEPAGQYYPLATNAGAMNVLLFRNATKHLFSSRHPDQVCQEICDDYDETECGKSATGIA